MSVPLCHGAKHACVSEPVFSCHPHVILACAWGPCRYAGMQRYAERSASTKSKSSKATPSGMGSVLPHSPKSFSAVSVQSLSACCVLNAVYNHVMFCVNRALRAFGEQYMGASNSGIEGRASDDQNQNDSGEELGEDDGMQYYSKRKSAEPRYRNKKRCSIFYNDGD